MTAPTIAMFSTSPWISGVQIAILCAILYGILIFLKGTRGGGIIKGFFFFIILGFIVISLVLRSIELPHLDHIFQGLVTIAAVFMVVIFQPEIRRGLMRIGQNPFVGHFLRTDPGFVPELVKAVRSMSREKIGALIAIERDVGLRGITEGGVLLDAELKSETLETIFWPGSALHDGGVLIQNSRLAWAGCIFPLTENPQVSRRLGTRHRAAIGLSEETDAISVIVSEETGAISIAHRGKLHRRLEPEAFEELLRAMLANKNIDTAQPTALGLATTMERN